MISWKTVLVAMGIPSDDVEDKITDEEGFRRIREIINGFTDRIKKLEAEIATSDGSKVTREVASLQASISRLEGMVKTSGRTELEKRCARAYGYSLD